SIAAFPPANSTANSPSIISCSSSINRAGVWSAAPRRPASPCLMDRVRLYYMRCALFVATLLTPLVMASNATDFQISSFAATGRISWTGASSNGVCSIETATAPTGPWLPQRNLFSTNRVGQVSLPTPSDNRFYRLLTADISATPSGYSNLLAAYGIIETIAGRGGGRSDVTNYWQPEFEGAPATNADLS